VHQYNFWTGCFTLSKDAVKYNFNLTSSKEHLKWCEAAIQTPRYFTELTNCNRLLPSTNGLNTELKRGPILRLKATDFFVLVKLGHYSIPKSVLTDCIYIFLFSNQYSQIRFVKCCFSFNEWMNTIESGVRSNATAFPLSMLLGTWRVMRRMTSPLGFIDIINYSIYTIYRTSSRYTSQHRILIRRTLDIPQHAVS